MAKFRSFEDIESWRKARELAREIYRISMKNSFARDVTLTEGIRRATIAIMSNIAQGFEHSDHESFLQSLKVARGSVGEVKAHLYIALDQKYISLETFKQLGAIISEINTLLTGLMNYLRAAAGKGNKKSEQ